MIETILLARNRKTGKQEILMGSETEFHAQKSKLHEYDPETNEDFDRIGLYQLVPQKKVLKLVTKKELSDLKAKHQKTIDDAAKPAVKTTDLKIAAAEKAEQEELTKSRAAEIDEIKSATKKI